MEISRSLVPGHNVDKVDVEAGLIELTNCGYTEERTIAVIDYNLRRWARGEESAADKGAIDKTFYGIDFTSWRRVLAAAIVAAEKEESQAPDRTRIKDLPIVTTQAVLRLRNIAIEQESKIEKLEKLVIELHEALVVADDWMPAIPLRVKSNEDQVNKVKDALDSFEKYSKER